jgi:hypothetical protein
MVFFGTLLDPIQSLVRSQLGNTEMGMDTKLYLTIAAIVAILYALAFLVIPVQASMFFSGFAEPRAVLYLIPRRQRLQIEPAWRATRQQDLRPPSHLHSVLAVTRKKFSLHSVQAGAF